MELGIFAHLGTRSLNGLYFRRLRGISKEQVRGRVTARAEAPFAVYVRDRKFPGVSDRDSDIGSDTTNSQRDKKVSAGNFGCHVPFAIEEPVHKVVTSKPRVPNPTDRWDYDTVAKREPGGKLVLCINAYTWGKYEQRKRWSDAKVQRLENMVAEIVAGLMRTALSLRRQDEERKRQEAERERRARDREQLRKDIDQKEKKLAHLNESVHGWRQAELIRGFAAVYTQKVAEWPSEKRIAASAWIAWALQQADRMDPLVLEKPYSILDRKQEIARSW